MPVVAALPRVARRQLADGVISTLITVSDMAAKRIGGLSYWLTKCATSCRARASTLVALTD